MRPQNTSCTLPFPEQCVCNQSKDVVRTCLYMRLEDPPKGEAPYEGAPDFLRRDPPHTSGFAQTVPSKSAEGTSPMEQPGALSPNGAMSPDPLAVAEAATGMTREQAFAPNAILEELPFVPSDGAMKYEPREPLIAPEKAALLEAHAAETRASLRQTSPGESVPNESKKREFREACEQAFELVKEATENLANANKLLEGDARSAKLRRAQRNAFNALSQAQFTLEMSFDRVPPRQE